MRNRSRRGSSAAPRRRLRCATAVLLTGVVASALPVGVPAQAATPRVFDYPCHSSKGATGDFNNDGFPDLAVGAPGDDLEQTDDDGSVTRGFSDAGSINVVYANPDRSGLDPQYAVTGDADDTRTRKHFSQNTPGVEETSEASDSFGFALASGNFDGTGGDDLAVGVPGENNGRGAVQILYSGPSNGQTINSRANTDGLVVGIPGSATSNQLIHQDTPSVDGSAEDRDHFGYALAAGDLNGDEYADLVVGAPGEDLGSVADAGIVQIIYGTPHGLDANGPATGGVLPDQMFQQGPGEIRRPEIGRAEPGDYFGAALTVAQLNDVSPEDVAIGAPGEDVRVVPDGGAVRVLYSQGPTGPSLFEADFFTQQAPNVNGISETADRMGCSLAGGDYDGDGDDDLAVGTPGEALGPDANAGVVQVLYNTATSSGLSVTPNVARSTLGFWIEDQVWDEDARRIPGDAKPDDRLGAALVSGDFNNDDAEDLAIGLPTEMLYTSNRSGSVRIMYGSRGFGLTDGPGSAPELARAPLPVAFAQSPSDLSSACLLYGLLEDPSILAPLGDALGGPCLLPNALLGSNDYAPLLMIEEQGDLFGASLAAADFDLEGGIDLAIGSPGEGLGLFADWLAEEEATIPDELLPGLLPLDEAEDAGVLNVVYAPFPAGVAPPLSPAPPSKQDVIYRDGAGTLGTLRSLLHTLDAALSLGLLQDDQIHPVPVDPSRSDVLEGDNLGASQS